MLADLFTMSLEELEAEVTEQIVARGLLLQEDVNAISLLSSTGEVVWSDFGADRRNLLIGLQTWLTCPKAGGDYLDLRNG